MKHKLDLLGNAVDSLNQGLRSYEEAEAGDVGAHKFAVLHVAHFVELLLKHAVAKEHMLLIYRRPSSKQLKDEPTINLWDAIHILKHAGHSFDESLLTDLEWLKSLRNDIEHYQFEMDPHEVRDTLGRIIKAAHTFAEETIEEDVATLVASRWRETYDVLYSEYLSRLRAAKQRAAMEAGDDERITYCNGCDESDVALESLVLVRCLLCGAREEKRDCAVCGNVFRVSEMVIWNDDDPHEISYACYSCEDDLLGEGS